MFEFEAACIGQAFCELGPRARELMRFFGMSMEGLRRRAVRYRVSLRLEAGQVCWIGGPSGAGKSVLLGALYAQAPVDERIRVESIALERDRAVIDCVTGPLSRSLELLSRAGLSDVPCLLRPPAMLSNGQQWRYRLARALMSGRQLIFADEFCASLDATTAGVAAYQVRRIATASRCIFVLAGCREDVLAELRPDVLVVLGGREADVIYQNSGRNPSRSKEEHSLSIGPIQTEGAV